jgi:hypothetical protein
MREGQPAPHPIGEPDTSFAYAQSYQLNNSGAVAFMTNLLEAGQLQSTRQSLWVRSPDGFLERVVADGDLLPVEVGDQTQMREVLSLRLADNTKNIPLPRFFNDAGQLSFMAVFNDGSRGNFVYTPAIPGDFDADGTVDMADYVVWRKTDGSQAGYDRWRMNFGATTSTGAGATNSPINTAVPEPWSFVLTLLAAAPALLQRHRIARPSLAV